MTPTQRFLLANRLCIDTTTLALAGIRWALPHATDKEVRRELARRRYGQALADAAYGSANSA